MVPRQRKATGCVTFLSRGAARRARGSPWPRRRPGSPRADRRPRAKPARRFDPAPVAFLLELPLRVLGPGARARARARASARTAARRPRWPRARRGRARPRPLGALRGARLAAAGSAGAGRRTPSRAARAPPRDRRERVGPRPARAGRPATARWWCPPRSRAPARRAGVCGQAGVLDVAGAAERLEHFARPAPPGAPVVSFAIGVRSRSSAGRASSSPASSRPSSPTARKVSGNARLVLGRRSASVSQVQRLLGRASRRTPRRRRA